MEKAVRFCSAVMAVLVFVMITSMAFAEEKSSTPVDMTGTWKLNVQTSLGSGPAKLKLKQKDDIISGTYHGSIGVEKVKGQVSGENFTLTFISQGVKVIYNGTIDGDNIKGTIDLPPFGKGSFTGKR